VSRPWTRSCLSRTQVVQNCARRGQIAERAAGNRSVRRSNERLRAVLETPPLSSVRMRTTQAGGSRISDSMGLKFTASYLEDSLSVFRYYKRLAEAAMRYSVSSRNIASIRLKINELYSITLTGSVCVVIDPRLADLSRFSVRPSILVHQNIRDER
jgi:hypothetical protein